jgi:hypothetical protein
MRQYRKIAVVALLCFAAVITPPDVVSQTLIFFPCYALYEYGIRIAQRIEARRAKEEAAYQAQLAAEKAAAEKQAAEVEEAKNMPEQDNDDVDGINDSSAQDIPEQVEGAASDAEVAEESVEEPSVTTHSYDSDMASPEELPSEVESRKVEYIIECDEVDDSTGLPIKKEDTPAEE